MSTIFYFYVYFYFAAAFARYPNDGEIEAPVPIIALRLPDFLFFDDRNQFIPVKGLQIHDLGADK